MAAKASLFRKESRWGLYHYCLDYPDKNNEEWFCHVPKYRTKNVGSREKEKNWVEKD
ncbi:MAG: hypothetical protein KA717_32175 [Woronichinia naegeliana WA131]|uniref:Fumarate reductase/succinate dehydrogenase flavoprotein-like C-terminal domain-containing protein n=1 Tax=Woronichinia naegeliana WA131 TaxID=2824559 RepID=A0A977PW48_9CYAN|nr:MAG: hypothetical protein KA717_32175 [Woronichinia naegeliana WA131]